MAENVEKNLEDLSKYMNLLQELGIFSSAESNRLTERINQCERQLELVAGGTQLMENYQQTIELEIGLIKEIKRRKREKDVSGALTGECYFIQKVIGHYQKGLKYFPDNFDFHLQFFNFIKLFPNHENVTDWLIKDLLAAFGGTKPEVFRKVASYYFYCNKHEEARKILLSGQSKYPKEVDIYLDLLELELRCTNKTGLSERLKRFIDFIGENKIGRRFMEETILMITTQLNLRNIAEYGLDKLLSTYEEVDSYMFAANWELKADQSQSKTEGQKYSVEAVDKAVKRVKQGIFALPTDKKPEMWKSYINFMKKISETDPKLKSFLARTLQEAENSRIKLSEEHFFDCLACHKSNRGIVLAKLEKAIHVYPDSDLVRIMYLKYLLMAGHRARAAVEFNKALEALGSNTLRVWEVYLAAITVQAKPDEVLALFERGIKDRNPNVSAAMKAKYCVWTGVTTGLEKARELYFKLATTQPYSNELHREMVQMERVKCAPPTPEDMEIMNRILSLWQLQFGNVEKDVYLHRLEILRELGCCDRNAVEKVQKQAVAKLKDPAALAEFQSSFESYQNLSKSLNRSRESLSKHVDPGSSTNPDPDSPSLTVDKEFLVLIED